jgi:hypothetical protein
MEWRRNQFPLPPPLLESIATQLLFFHVTAHRGGRTDGRTDGPTDGPTQSSIEVLFAPKNKKRSKLLTLKISISRISKPISSSLFRREEAPL